MGTKSRETVSKTFVLEDCDPRLLFGQNDAFLRRIEQAFTPSIVARGDRIIIEGEAAEVNRVFKLFEDLTARLAGSDYLTEQYLNYAIEMIKEEGDGPAKSMADSEAADAISKPYIRPKTIGQKKYLEAIRGNDIVFSIGPSGTGKTYLAVGVAVAELKEKRVGRIVLVRPAVEAGESLGFLPGDIRAKVDPYLRPVYDALHNMMPPDKIQKYLELGTIEILPLAFMRGRTLDRTFIILDEAQNTTPDQMKMFLTRLGQGSKAIITGDVTQIDLEVKKKSGLIIIQKILLGIDGIKFVYLTDKDVVRHPLVQQIIRAYERFDKNDRKE
ncbi:MAG: PhoH family protein [Candidatus Zixiibacteriota bacterium]|nr:MAG: PhoH family protein [candidate division Zixibacteria bacterium]